jgi:hypothetical protein
MASTWKLRSAKTLALAATLGTIALLTGAFAQEAAPKATWLKAGFVRPGADGKIAEGVEGTIGGTIYYAVYQLPAGALNAADPYNTGMPDLAKQFMPGGGSSGMMSPPSLTSGNPAKYLYLYQLVNDRGLESPASTDGIRLASTTDVKTRDIGSLILKLPVDASAIQTWGYFKGAGFSMRAFDRDSQEKAISATKSVIGVSANPSILVSVRGMNGTYNRMASPTEFAATSGFTVDKAGKNLKNSRFYEDLESRGKAKLVAWEQDALKAAETGGENPEKVELMKFSDGDKTKANTILRALFKDNPLKVGRNSVLIGFTSNMAPGNDLVRIQDADAAKKNTGIRTVSIDDIDFGAGGLVPLPKEQPKDAPVANLGPNQKPSNLIADGIVSPGDIPSGTKLVDRGAYKTFGGTVYFAVYKRTTAIGGGDTWGVGRSDFDGLFVPGESYRATFSPRLDTDAEYLYLYEVVNDRGFHDLKLPQNKAIKETPVAVLGGEERTPITREVASFSLFLRTDPRLITSWGFFEDSGFVIKVPNELEHKQVALNDPNATPPTMNMAVSSNISILETLYPSRDKVYRSWIPPVSVDFSKTSFGIGKDTTNISANPIKAVGNDRAGSIRFVANKTLEKTQATGAIRPDYTQIMYFDGSNPVNGATIDGITLGPAEVARAVFKVDWLTKTIVEGQQSVVFGFTSNVEPVRAPVRIKDLATTINNSSEAQERVFLGPTQIQSLARNAVANSTAVAPATGTAVANAPSTAAAIALVGLSGDADAAAVAVAEGLGQGIIPAGIGALARANVGNGIALANNIATPNVGGVGEAVAGGAGVVGFPPTSTSTTGTSGSGVGGGMGASIGALGTARMPMFGGAGGSGGGSGSGSNQGSAGSTTTGTTGSTGSGQGSGAGTGSGSGTGTVTNTNNINFTISQANQQTQSQFQFQSQQQSQNQNQNQNQRHGHHGHHNGNVVPAPASLLLGLLGIPGLYVAYRRRRGKVSPDGTPAEVVADTAGGSPDAPASVNPG